VCVCVCVCLCGVQVTVDGVKHVVVFAKRPLVKGEEISKMFFLKYLQKGLLKKEISMIFSVFNFSSHFQ